MALDKFASWGKLPPVRPAKPGLATIIEKGFAQVGSGRGATPSEEAFRLIAVLGQARDALLDQNKATPKSVNTQLAIAKGSQAAQDAHALLGRLDPVLADGFFDQFRPVDAKAFGPARRERVAELMAFESKLARRVQ